jgi:hypothetical protein
MPQRRPRERVGCANLAAMVKLPCIPRRYPIRVSDATGVGCHSEHVQNARVQALCQGVVPVRHSSDGLLSLERTNRRPRETAV